MTSRQPKYGINWIPRCAFIINNKEFIITGVWWRAGVKDAYEFKDRQGKLYTKSASEFHEKIKDDNFLGLK